MEVQIHFTPPRIIGSTNSIELELVLNSPPTELYFEQGKRDKNIPPLKKGSIPRRPVSRVWIKNEGDADIYYDIGSSIEGPADLHLTSLLRADEAPREFKTPENTITAVFLQAQVTTANLTPTSGKAYVRLETLT